MRGGWAMKGALWWACAATACASEPSPTAVVVDASTAGDAAVDAPRASVPSATVETPALRCVTDRDCPDEGLHCDAWHRCVTWCVPGWTRCVNDRTVALCADDGYTYDASVCPDRAEARSFCRNDACAIECDPGAYNCDDDLATGCESRAPCHPVLLSGFGGSTGFGPDAQCLHPTNDGSYAGPDAREGDAPAPIDLRGAFAPDARLLGMPLDTMFVNANGNVTLGRPLATATPTAFPIAGLRMFAPWWADVDTRGGGQPARNNVCFVVQPRRVVVTWDGVGAFDRRDDRRNSFQLVIRARDGRGWESAFDIDLRYERCEWAAAEAPNDVAAQVGFDAGDRMNFVLLPQSRTAAIVDLCRTTNIPGGRPGVHRFQVRTGRVSGEAAATTRR